MHWDSAWTPYPARIYAEGLEINIHTWTTDSVLRADQADANIRILPLFSNHLLVDNITAGVSVRILSATKAEVEFGEEENRGIFWGKLGIFSLGMERENEERDWKFIRPQHWYEKRKAQSWSD